eukprot:s420_g24.t1
MRALVDKGCEHVRFTRLSKLRVISDLIKARWADHANVQKRAAESLYAGRTVKRLRFIVSANMVLDGILTVVDAKHIVGQLQEEKPQGAVNEAVEQIAFADRILLNKTDLVGEADLLKVEAEIRHINKTAAIRKTQNSRVDMDFILGIKAFSLEKILMQISQNLEEELVAEHGSGHGDHGGHGGHGHEGHAHSHSHDEDCEECGHSTHRRHDYRVSSVGIQRDREVQKDKSWL